MNSRSSRSTRKGVLISRGAYPTAPLHVRMGTRRIRPPPAIIRAAVDFWRSALIGNVLGLAVLLAIAAALRTRIGALRRLAIPDGIVAGALGLVLGPNLADVMPLSGRDL